MTPELFHEIGLSPALGLLPLSMDRVQARAMVLCICLHESGFAARRQMGNGPARSYAQFELTGIDGVLTHLSTGGHARHFCLDLDIGPTAPAVYEAIEFHDVLAAGFARLLLWTLRRPLPARTMPDDGYAQYRQAWNPNPEKAELRRHEWIGNWEHAWSVVQG
jgi:hypothetical protein